MFSLENDRQDYGRLLAPLQGYEIETAVGTTYSLDLEALTFTAISLGLGGDTDSMLGRNPISMLNALRKVTDRVVLFYESGHLQIPADCKNNKLYQLLEKITIPVALPAAPKGSGNYPSFHPKTWLLCYQNVETKQRLYRFVVMSRNLTFDRSWDIVVAFNGVRTESQQDTSLPIAQFIRFLRHQTNSDRAYRIVDTLRQAVAEVKFDIGDFHGVKFLPIGLKYNGYDIDADEWLGSRKAPFHELVIMSPFVSKDIISRFNDDCRRLRINSRCDRTLITRASELEKLDAASAANFNIFAVKDEVVDGESEISEDTLTARKQDIHAKILMFARNGQPSHIYMGSMNASHNGFYRNIEFDVCLWCHNGMMGPTRFLQELGLDTPRSPFAMRELPEGTSVETESNSIDMALKRICRSDAHGTVTTVDDEIYSVALHFNPEMIAPGMTIQPISGKCAAIPIDTVTEFSCIELTDITEYYRIHILDEAGDVHTRIIQIPIDGIPAERDSKICNSVIDSKNRLYEYISLILSDDKTQALLENCDVLGGDGKFQFVFSQTPSIYEKLLEASLHHRERFREINDIMQMLPKDSDIVAEFKSLYNVFRQALKLKDDE